VGGGDASGSVVAFVFACLPLLAFSRSGDCLHRQLLSLERSRDGRFILHELQELIFVPSEFVHIVPDDEHNVVAFINGLKRPAPSRISFM
jgi:hypothetical protein